MVNDNHLLKDQAWLVFNSEPHVQVTKISHGNGDSTVMLRH